ncbi:MAG: molybdopterin-binding protein [Hyphomicrobiales bacterium]|nr:molybdopterin-binding protein [Hyphomicrobiales bacterium]
MTTPLSLTALSDAQAVLLAMLAPVAPQRVACAQAVGLVAAEALCAEAAQPPRAVALRDGYALRAEDLAGASGFAPAFLDRMPQRVALGEALPEGCDCVLDAAALDVSGPMAQVFVESWPGENVRRAGEDLAKGVMLVAQGHRITARDALVAARAGVATLSVRQPKVALQGAEDDLRAFLTHMLLAQGVALTDEGADLVLALAAPTEATISARGLALEPGRDCAIGRLGAMPLVVLPNQPDQALAGLHALVRPALDALSARTRATPMSLPLGAKISSRVGVAELALLEARGDVFMPLAVGDAPIGAFRAATHVALIAAHSEGHAAGELFSAEPLDE